MSTARLETYARKDIRLSKKPPTKTVEALTHAEAKRRNIPTAEYQSVVDEAQKHPRRERFLAEVKAHLGRGLSLRGGTIVDATIIAVPISVGCRLPWKTRCGELLTSWLWPGRRREVGGRYPRPKRGRGGCRTQWTIRFSPGRS